MYYFRNIHWGLIIYFIAVYLMREDLDQPDVKVLLVILLINSLLFPFAKKAIEKLALKFSTRESWMTGFYTETPMKKRYLRHLLHGCFYCGNPRIRSLPIIFNHSQKRRSLVKMTDCFFTTI